ncbi:two-component response regulator ARR2-like [Salvia divinorum]|uniref:Two-component response regulator ARR2-like n=1 Tax=Salvia divinorum TaxID=28513 RepID=A0ABD1HRQ4_SALDI
MASIHAMIHVLLIDHDAEALNIAHQLETLQYKVSCAELPYSSISILANAKFDVVMANINSPDPQCFRLLLQHALNMCIPVVLMADDDNTFLWALENEAFLCIKKPPSMEFLRCLLQHAMREKPRMIRDQDIIASNNLGSAGGVEFRDVVHHKNLNPDLNPNPRMMVNKKGNYKSRCRGRYEDYDEQPDYMMSQNGTVRKKMCTEWTRELHDKFENAVVQLGEGRCFPKEILELMNEPGLTRMQVASHLQKCRNEIWKSPEERKPSVQTSHHSSPNGNRSQVKPRRFGSMPKIYKPSKTQVTGQMKNGSTTMSTTPQHYGTDFMHSSDEYLNLNDMDSLIHDFSASHQINNPTDKTCEPSMKTKSRD